jgi:SnoaL-like domain
MNQDQTRAIEHDLRGMLDRFFVLLDAHDGDGAAKLFTDDVEWATQRGGIIKGPAGVAKNISERPAGYVSRHCLTNFVVDAKDENTAETTGYVLVFGIDTGPEPPKGPAPLGAPRSILTYHSKFRRTPAGWRIAAQRSDRTFSSV